MARQSGREFRSIEDVASEIRTRSSPLVDLLGLRIESATPDEIVATLRVDPEKHLHPWNAVHGGVYCTIVETLATLGAQFAALPEGKVASGIENHTSFLRQVREGEITARATPIQRGKQLHLWEVRVTDAEARPVAYGVVRLMLLEQRGA